MFTETNPDKGTETNYSAYIVKYGWYKSLQKLTPIRGRKLSLDSSESMRHGWLFTETNPDKGTETMLGMVEGYKDAIGLQKLTPIRGRKQ